MVHSGRGSTCLVLSHSFCCICDDSVTVLSLLVLLDCSSFVTFPGDFRIDGTFISGTIPTEIGQLSTLEVLDFSNLSLKGGVPFEIASCTSLRKYCFLHVNSLLYWSMDPMRPSQPLL